jgi:predicted PurR-regulated permease PerM
VAQAQQANDWARASQGLKGIKDYGGKAKYLLWWAPRAEKVVGQASSFAGILGEFTSAIDLYERSLQAGLPRDVAVSLVALSTAMKFVPVLGGMYGQIVDGIPGLVEWFRNLNEDYFRRIDQATRG